MWVEDKEGHRWLVKKSVWEKAGLNRKIWVYHPQYLYHHFIKKELREVK